MPDKITYLTGDATLPLAEGKKIIAHVCNDIGGWGAGFVLALSRRFPEAEQAYREWFERRSDPPFELGEVQFVQVALDIEVANMIGQRGIHESDGRPPVRYEAIERCLGHVADRARDLGASVHMPRIGSGLAGGRWEEIEPIIERQLVDKMVPTFVYDLKRD